MTGHLGLWRTTSSNASVSISGTSCASSFATFRFPRFIRWPNPAAETAEFTARHDKFWPMHDGLFLNQRQLGMPLLFALAGSLELPQAELRGALTSGACAGKVQNDFLGGVRSGVNGTPTFFLNRLRYDAPWDFGNLARAIEGALVEARGVIENLLEDWRS